MSYYYFLNKLDKNNVQTIFELGSRDLIDAIKLLDYFSTSKIYAFECNPECLIECNKNICNLDERQKEKLTLVNKAVSLTNGEVKFYPFDLQKYNNMGASSMLKIDFSCRNKNDPDYNRENPQKEITVEGIRLDTFIDENCIEKVDLLCIDLQGYELNALKSLGQHLYNVKYIITECSTVSTYINGATFDELNNYLINYNFKYICSLNPNQNTSGFTEYDVLFINQSVL
jgi:FkbM family methyltransferase